MLPFQPIGDPGRPLMHILRWLKHSMPLCSAALVLGLTLLKVILQGRQGILEVNCSNGGWSMTCTGK